ncbi:MAG TPA: SDR family NAD(P)-dependent oxidoreductase [Candidatus Binatia bacterium]|nr:SDR family NAD(P)-dependent oxidoreductase [Candidatus Binatia bacterium]
MHRDPTQARRAGSAGRDSRLDGARARLRGGRFDDSAARACNARDAKLPARSPPRARRPARGSIRGTSLAAFDPPGRFCRERCSISAEGRRHHRSVERLRQGRRDRARAPRRERRPRGAQELEEVARECERDGGRAIAVPTDVSVREQMEALGKSALDAFGRIDVWVNNAGVGALGRFEDVPLDLHDQVVRTDLLGTLYGTYVAYREFVRQRSGTLINVSSELGKHTVPYFASYAAAKHGVVGLSDALRQEVGQNGLDGIHVCVVLPTAHDTPFFDHAANYTGHEVKARGPCTTRRTSSTSWSAWSRTRRTRRSSARTASRRCSSRSWRPRSPRSSARSRCKRPRWSSRRRARTRAEPSSDRWRKGRRSARAAAKPAAEGQRASNGTLS